MFSTSLVCLIVCHAGPAEHFAQFSKKLKEKGFGVELHASGPAFEKLRQLDVENLFSFATDGKGLRDIASRCKNAFAVITDVGHPFDLSLQEELKKKSASVLRCAYYDNPEAFVPGGYSELAEKVMLAANRVLFANEQLVRAPLYSSEEKEISLPRTKRRGVGFYPLHHSEKIRTERKENRETIRRKFFDRHQLVDRGQKILVFMGGNNEEYFSKALPSFLSSFSQLSNSLDLGNYLLVLQQHPGAKAENLDAAQFKEILKEAAENVVSVCTSEEMQIAADAILYHQTSMAPQFALAGIPTIQVGHKPFKDLLVRHKICEVANTPEALKLALCNLEKRRDINLEGLVKNSLGISQDWSDLLQAAILR